MKLTGEYQLKWIQDNFRLKAMYAGKAKHSQSLKLDGLETFVGCHLNELSYLKIWEFDKLDQYTLGVPALFLLSLYVKNCAQYYLLFHLLFY